MHCTNLLRTYLVCTTLLSTILLNGQNYNLNTSLDVNWPAPKLIKPNYLQEVIDPIYNTKITRITGDSNMSIPNISNVTWKNVARHGYSTRQPWNADESIIYLGKHKDLKGSSGPDLFLDGESYAVIKEARLPRGNEHRWHHTNPDLFVIVRDTEIISWSYSTERITQLISYPGYTNVKMGGTGNFSDVGNRVAVSATKNKDNKTVIFTLDLAAKSKGVDIDIPDNVELDYVSISALGNYIIVKGSVSLGGDRAWVYDLKGNLIGFWNEYGRPSHFDLAVDQNGDEVAVGVSKSNPDKGCLIKRRLFDGKVTVLTDGGWPPHTSARAIQRPGWVFASTSSSTNYPPYLNEIIAVKLDGSRIERICHTRNVLDEYLNEAHPCPSPSGSRVIFASDWGNDNVPIQAYIADFRN